MSTAFYFGRPDRVQALRGELLRWRGTPFLQGDSTPGQGADCLRFVIGVLDGCGVPVEQLGELPRFSLREGRHTEQTRLVVWLLEDERAQAHLKHVDRDDPPEPGDIMAVKPRGSLGANHLAIAAGPRALWHCDLVSGVGTIHPHQAKIVMRFRLLDNFESA